MKFKKKKAYVIIGILTLGFIIIPNKKIPSTEEIAQLENITSSILVNDKITTKNSNATTEKTSDKNMDKNTTSKATSYESKYIKKYSPGITLEEMFGLKNNTIVNILSSHENDNYFLGTPAYDDTEWNESYLTAYNGSDKTPKCMNCAGFVASVFLEANADITPIRNGGNGFVDYGGYINGSNWFEWLKENGITYYEFDSISDLLKSKKAKKGDIVFFEPVDWDSEYDDYGNFTDCHMGFFWGDTPSDNKFWNSTLAETITTSNGTITTISGNQISLLAPCSESIVYLFCC